MTSTRRFRVASVIAAITITGCALQEDSSPRDIPEEQQVDFGFVVTGDEAVGENRIYLVTSSAAGSETQLRAVARAVAAEPNALLDSLLLGPNTEELDQQLGTAIPPALAITSARTIGRVLTIDVNDALDELTSDGLRLALAQLVTTASELDSVDAVRIRTAGENQSWPTGDGELTDRPLTTYDYPGLVETSQPRFPAIPA